MIFVIITLPFYERMKRNSAYVYIMCYVYVMWYVYIMCYVYSMCSQFYNGMANTVIRLDLKNHNLFCAEKNWEPFSEYVVHAIVYIMYMAFTTIVD